MCRVINLFGGPGTGKSTTAAGLFNKMKKLGLKVELVREYAKDLVYDERHNVIKEDQLYIYAKQQRRMKILHDHVDYIITDSPLFLSVVYGRMYKNLNKYLEQYIIDNNFKYENINIFLNRNLKEHKYQEYGRSQTLEEAQDIDTNIKNDLNECKIPFHILDYSDDDLINEILDISLKKEDHMKLIIYDNYTPFKPFAYYDAGIDILTVQIEDCSYTEIKHGLFNIFKKNHILEDKLVGFNIEGASYVFGEINMTTDICIYNIGTLLNRIMENYSVCTKSRIKYMIEKIYNSENFMLDLQFKYTKRN